MEKTSSVPSRPAVSRMVLAVLVGLAVDLVLGRWARVVVVAVAVGGLDGVWEGPVPAPDPDPDPVPDPDPDPVPVPDAVPDPGAAPEPEVGLRDRIGGSA